MLLKSASLNSKYLATWYNLFIIPQQLFQQRNSFFIMRKFIVFFTILWLSGVAVAQHNLYGTITDQNGEPLPGAAIDINEGAYTNISDSDGFYMFRNLEKGTYKMVVSYLGFETIKKTVDINKRKTILDIALTPIVYVTLPVVVSGSWVNQNTPVTFTNVDKEEIEKLNLGQDVPYLLRWTPSAVVTSDAGTGIGYTGIRIRGTDPSRINVSINGIPLNDAESQGVFWVDLPDFASSVDQIQIQRGVGTSTNGAGAFGATINLNTTEVEKEPYLTLFGGAGSFNTFNTNIALGSGQLKNKFVFDGRFSKIDADGYIDRGTADLLSFYGSAAYLGDHQSLRLVAFHGAEVTYQAWNGVPVQYINDEKLRTFNTAGMEKEGVPHDNEVDDYKQTHVQLLYKRRINDNWDLDVALHYTKGKGFFEQYKAGEILADFNIEVPHDSIASDLIRRRWLDNDFYGLTYGIHYSNPENKLGVTVGGALNNYDGRHFGEIIWTNFTGALAPAPRYYDNDAQKLDFNSYTKANYKVSSKLNGYLDLQYRFINYKFLGFDNDSSNVTQDDQLHFFNPKIGAVFQLNQSSRLYSSFGVANREPNRSDYTESTPASRPKHEKLYNTELGFRHEGTKSALGINLYHMNYNNQLAVTGAINDVGEYTRQNVKDSYRIGVELDGMIKITNGLSFNGSLTLSRNKIKKFTEFIDNWDYWFQDFENTPPEALEPIQFERIHKNTDLALSPNIIFGGALTYDILHSIKDHSLSFSLMNKYVGDQFIDNTSNNNAQLDAYFFSDFRIGYNLKTNLFKEIAFTLLIRNIFDARFSSNAWTYRYRSAEYDPRPDDPYTLLEEEAIYNQTGLYPQAGRNFLAGLTIKF